MKKILLNNGTYYTRENKSIPRNAGGGIQSFVSMLNLYINITGVFRFKVINLPIYSILRELM